MPSGTNSDISGGMKRFLLIAATTIVGFVLAACETTPTLRTQYDFDKTANFQTYKTYAWVGKEQLYVTDDLKSRVSPLLATRLARIVDEALASKGMTLADRPEAADVVVGMTVGARDKIRVDSYPASGFGRFYTGYSPNYWPAETRVSQQVEASLSIDMFDSKAAKPVWHGRGSRDFSTNAGPVSDQELRAHVAQILSVYPPAPATASP